MATTTHTMKAAAIDQFGGPEKLTLHTIAVPEIGPDEVLIRVDTAGIGKWDPWVREGAFSKMTGERPHFPFVLGADGSGTIAMTGKGVKDFREGDRVYGYKELSAKDGFYAEYIALKSNAVAPVPANMSLEAAGAMPADAVTALCGLELLAIQRGENELIFGASGGIGHLAVQLAKRMGARVFAVASGSDGVELVRQLGADAVIDGHSGEVGQRVREFAPEGIDAALFTASGDGSQEALATLRKGARLAYPNGVQPEPKGRDDVKTHAYNGRVTGALFERLNRWIEAAPFTVRVSATYPLDRAAEAHRAVAQHHLGKLALRVAH